MRKIVIALAVVLAASSAQAQHRHNGGGYNGGHQHRGGGGWVAPLVGGMVLGGVLYGLSQPSYAAPQPQYYQQPQYQRTCGYEAVYDVYGRYMGDRRVCNTIPIY